MTHFLKTNIVLLTQDIFVFVMLRILYSTSLLGTVGLHVVLLQTHYSVLYLKHTQGIFFSELQTITVSASHLVALIPTGSTR